MALYTSSIRNNSGIDVYETPKKSLDLILDHLNPLIDFIWEPFPGSGHSTNYMRERGFEVINGDNPDFFKQETLPIVPIGKTLILVTNPPFSIKKDIFNRLNELGLKRLAMLLPAAVMYTVYFNKYNKMQNENYNNQLNIIVHTSRCSFLDPETGIAVRRNGGKRKGNASFDIAWITYDVNLPQQITFPEHKKCKKGDK